jgi:hypothetical protein
MSAVIAACADAVFTAGAEAGERHGGRLPEPMRAVLDEAANICKIADLPDLYSHLGSRCITPFVILPKRPPRRESVGRGRYGRHVERRHQEAHRRRPGRREVRPGRLHPRRRHHVGRGSYSKSKDGYSRSVSEQREQILDPADIRAMRKGTALLMSTGMPIAQIALRPWYAEKAMAHIGEQMAAEEKAITKRAVAACEERKAARDGR